ncbi:hypothetical protein ACIBG7_16910 [Nonomuraea sp. NPDC050328]|uniref:hypothetical protein n=1 Tax=Nonomuraea sp. NPDC050328 TaxID=3364361 RepID=UPI0037B50CBA
MSVRSLALLGAVAAILGLGAAPAQADPKPGVMASPRLTIQQAGGGQCRLTVLTSVGMAQAQAQYQIDNGRSPGSRCGPTTWSTTTAS